MAAVLISSDLMLSSRVSGVASQVGLSLKTASNTDSAINECTEGDVTLVLIDLNLPKMDMKALVETLRELPISSLSIVAFGPHVHEAKLSAARQLGCDEVLARGQFLGQLEGVLSKGL